MIVVLRFDKIIFLTSHYPYEMGETFIENEMEYLEATSKEVLIFPTAARDFSRRRPVGAFTIVYPGGLRSKIRREFSALLALFHPVILFELTKLYCRHKLNLATLKTLLGYYVDANWKFQEIKKVLRGKIDSNEKILIYAYWLDKNAYIASKLKDVYPASITIARAHGFDIYLERHPFNYFPLRQATTKGIDYICPVSDNGYFYLLEHYPYMKNRLQVSRLGTIDHGLNPSEKESEFDLQIVSCSNLIPLKRVHLLIDALAKITKYKIEWTHFGDGPLRGELTARARKKLPENIICNFAGQVPNTKLMEIYQTTHFDLFINVSESEGVPVSIMEALSFGIPAIATNVGGTAEIVPDYPGGSIVSANVSTMELAENIKRFIALTPDDRKKSRSAARKAWEMCCNAAENYKSFYEMLTRTL